MDSLFREVGTASAKLGASIVDRTRDLASNDASRFLDDDPKGVGAAELRVMLDPSSTDRVKLQAMKRILGLMARGRDAAVFFPDVVKNVISQNFQVRKLVYIYLLRYAEQEPDLALLSVNSFQKDLDDSNHVIRALALRVLSSIRVEVIVPIVLLAVKKRITDMSPHVRKAAAHALPKLYSLDPGQKDELIDVLTRMLSDRSTQVISSVIAAFLRICPERLDLLHPHFRRLCLTLIDVDEWGQVYIIDLLMRYSRVYFPKPHMPEMAKTPLAKPKRAATANDSDDSQDDDASSSDDDAFAMPAGAAGTVAAIVDPDLRLLLDSLTPLLNSRNAAVIQSVASLYHHVAPENEVGRAARALTRLLSGPRETLFSILQTIKSLAAIRPEPFEPHIRRFFVRHDEPLFIRRLRLEVLASVTSSRTINIVLHELQTYIRDPSPAFAAETIQTIGRLANRLPAVLGTCMRALMGLARFSYSPSVVTESILVLRRLFQAQPEGRARSLRQLAKLLYRPAPEDQAPAAPPQLSPVSRAALYWLIGTFAEDVPRVAPDVFRCAVIAFPAEDTDAHVRLLTLVLGAKLLARCHGDATATTAPLFTPKVSSRIRGLFAHLLTLARYDVSYDVRDRARFLQALLNACPVDAPMANGDNGEHPLHLKVDPTALQPAAVLARIMLAAPGATRAGSGASPLPGESPDVAALARALQDVSLNDDGSLSAEVAAAGLVLGSLSRLVGHRVTGYLPLPNWPTSPPPPSSVRDVLVPTGPAMGGEVVNNLTGMGSGPVGARGGSGLRAGATAPAGLHPAVKAAARKAPIRHDQSALDAFLASSSDEYDTEEDDEEESDGYDSEESDGYDSEESDGYDSDDEEDESDDEEGDNLLDLSAPAAGANHRDYFAMSSEGESGSEYDDESDGQGHAQASHWGNGSDEGSYDEEESDEGSYDEEESDEESEEESDEEEE